MINTSNRLYYTRKIQKGPYVGRSTVGFITGCSLYTTNEKSSRRSFWYLERGRRIELLALAWKAKVLPLYEPRRCIYYIQNLRKRK